MGEGEGATKKSRRLEKPRSPCYRKQVPFWGSWLRTQVSLSWRDELQRHGPRGIAGDCVAERKYRRGDLCSGARRPSNEAGSTTARLTDQEGKYRLAHCERGETSRLTNSSNTNSMCLNAINLMCRERLAFGGMHSPGLSGVRATNYKFPFRGFCLRTQVFLSWRDELPRHGPVYFEKTKYE